MAHKQHLYLPFQLQICIWITFVMRSWNFNCNAIKVVIKLITTSTILPLPPTSAFYGWLIMIIFFIVYY